MLGCGQTLADTSTCFHNMLEIHKLHEYHASVCMVGTTHLQDFICCEGLQTILNGGGNALPTQPCPQASFALLHDRQRQVPEGLIGGKVALALVAVHCALQLPPKQVSDGAVVHAQVLAPQPLSLVSFPFSRQVFVLFIRWLLCDAILQRGKGGLV